MLVSSGKGKSVTFFFNISIIYGHMIIECVFFVLLDLFSFWFYVFVSCNLLRDHEVNGFLS